MMRDISLRKYEHGATALIVVVFSILLLITVTTGFMRLVVQDQIRSTNDELSRGAYDSALAGVEDGKRVLQAFINGNDDAKKAISDGKCNTVHTARILSAADGSHVNDEVMLQSSSGSDGGFEQAYTCLIIKRNTDDYLGNLDADMSRIIPLKTSGAFNTITFSWFKSAGLAQEIKLAPPASPGTPLRPLSAWSLPGGITPPVMRLQLITYKNTGAQLTDFDGLEGGSTVYLYPAQTGVKSASFAAIDSRGGANANPLRVSCERSGQYVCSVQLTLPHQISQSPSDYSAYLRVTSVYGPTDFSVMPMNTQFQDVQPIIDSTGRASDVFRRVAARVELINSGESQLYPRATVDISKSFCKAFGVTEDSVSESAECRYDRP